MLAEIPTLCRMKNANKGLDLFTDDLNISTKLNNIAFKTTSHEITEGSRLHSFFAFLVIDFPPFEGTGKAG